MLVREESGTIVKALFKTALLDTFFCKSIKHKQKACVQISLWVDTGKYRIKYVVGTTVLDLTAGCVRKKSGIV